MSGNTGSEANDSLANGTSIDQDPSHSAISLDTATIETDNQQQEANVVENRIVLRKIGPDAISYNELFLKNMSKKKMQVHRVLHFIPSVPIRVKITSYNRDSSKINPNLYMIEVQHGNFHWTVRRRYHHFMHLYRHFQFMKTAMNIPLSTQSYRNRRERGAIRVKENSNRGARFPFRPEALVPTDMMSHRVKLLQDYLNSALTNPLFVQSQDMCDFLEVSRISFIDQLGEKLKEGWVKKRSGDASSDGLVSYLQDGTRHYFCCYALAICGIARGSWETRWLFLKDSYLGYLHRDTGEIGAIILMDQGFKVSCGTTMGLKNAIVISNLTRQLILRDWTKRKAQEWIDSIEHVMRSTGKDFILENRFKSFAPPRPHSKCSWFVDGKDYMSAVADAIEAAQEEIFIADWWLSPEIYMKRPFVDGDKWRLDNILYRKAKEGVQIFIMLYKEVELALGINSLYTKKTLSKQHNNIRVLRHPDHVAGKSTCLLWAHHEKLVIIDQSVAFVGGIDLCYGRWDDKYHRLTDFGSMSASSKQVPGYTKIETSNTVGQHLPNTLMSLAKSTNQITFGALAVDPANRLAMKDKGQMTKRESVCSEDVPVMGKRATVMRTMRDLKTRGKGWADEIKDKRRHFTIRRRERPARNEPTIEESPDNSDDDSGKVEDSLYKVATQDLNSGFENPSLGDSQLNKLQPQGSAKYWIGKDYTNFIVKDFVDLDKPAQDGVNRLTTPRMPWHDIACAVTGPAARDVARHFIQRWNAIKVEKVKEHLRYPFLVPKSYNKSSFKTLDAVNADFTRAECQVIRSASEWNTGIATKETSILEAYLSAIENAKHYIYIENQFFITSTSLDDGIVNTIGKALYERIKRAHREGTRFRVIVVLPLLPGFQGQIGTNTGTAMQAILHWNYASICRGSTSLLGKLRGSGIDPLNYITFYGLRTHSELNDQPVTELVYVHSKLMIVDDQVVICGSANINDRSTVGKRDSEVALIVQDEEYTESLMDGKPYKAGKYAFSLRKRLFCEHLGLLSNEGGETNDIRDPVSDTFYKDTWIRIAALNTKVYEEVFRCIPCDKVTTFDELREFQTKLPLSFTEPLVAKQRIASEVQGYLVLLPLNFLNQENLKPPAASAEGLMPTSLWT